MNKFLTSQGGYIGQKMSVRAMEAYEHGSKPLSQWRKADIIEALEAELDGITIEFPITLDDVKKFPLWLLKQEFLTYTSWHHSGKYYNKTEFYDVNIEAMEKDPEYFQALIEEHKAAKATPVEFEYGYIEYEVWGGTRKHPKVIGHESAYGIVINGWLHNGSFKKKVSGNSITKDVIKSSYKELVKEVPALKGTKKEFNNIIKWSVK